MSEAIEVEEREIEYVPKRVPTNEGWEGYVLANSIYKLEGDRNILLLREGWKLTKSNILRLKGHGIENINVMVEKKSPDPKNDKQEQTECNEDDEGG
jgi:hypothetical protein